VTWGVAEALKATNQFRKFNYSLLLPLVPIAIGRENSKEILKGEKISLRNLTTLAA